MEGILQGYRPYKKYAAKRINTSAYPPAQEPFSHTIRCYICKLPKEKFTTTK